MKSIVCNDVQCPEERCYGPLYGIIQWLMDETPKKRYAVMAHVQRLVTDVLALSACDVSLHCFYGLQTQIAAVDSLI